MISRCLNPRNDSFDNYGGRGIKVCYRWRESFVAFYKDMGPKPRRGLSIDRIDNNGNYEPGNCRWAGTFEQSRNMRKNILIEHDGRTHIISDWAVLSGIPLSLLSYRLKRGWSFDRAISTPVAKSVPRQRPSLQLDPVCGPMTA